jgi:hypothetical protein
MDATYSDNISTPFVIGSEDVTKLGELLTTQIGEVKCRIQCADGISREFNSVSELTEYDNPRSKEIVGLRLSARNKDWSKDATLDFSGSRWRGISIEFRGDEETVFRLKTATLDILDGTRPWYDSVQSVDFVLIELVAFFMLWFAVMFSVAIKRSSSRKSKKTTSLNDKQSAIGQLSMIGIIAAVFGVGIGLNSLRDSWFPRAVFAIGQGNACFQSLERFHWSFLVAVLASVVAGVALLIIQVSGKTRKTQPSLSVLPTTPEK